MQDIVEARKRLRELVTPLRRRVGSYHLEENLGAWRLGAYDDNATQVVIEISVTPTDDYPTGQYSEESSTLRVSKPTRSEAITEVQAQVEAKLPEWRKEIAIDLFFSRAVGKQVRIIKETEEFITNQDEERKVLGFDYREPVKLTKGTILDVVGHEPGKLILQLEGKKFDMYFWRFTNYIIHRENLRGPDTHIPDPQIEFTDGFAPWELWELPGVEEDHDVARSGQG
jgi:hypothetical protein